SAIVTKPGRSKTRFSDCDGCTGKLTCMVENSNCTSPSWLSQWTIGEVRICQALHPRSSNRWTLKMLRGVLEYKATVLQWCAVGTPRTSARSRGHARCAPDAWELPACLPRTPRR